MKTGYNIEYKGRTYQVDHGDPFDRGMADSYYGRIRGPHKGGVGGTSGLRDIDLTQQEIADYNAGYDYNESTGDKKEW
jgi:hypothetical protein